MALPLTFAELAKTAATVGLTVESAVDGAAGIFTGPIVDSDDDGTLLLELSGDAAAELRVSHVWIRPEQIERAEAGA